MAPGTDLAPLADLAREAALAAGTLIRGAGRGVAPQEKARHDYVTAVDRAAEEAIRAVLGRGAPSIPVLGEEGGGPDAAPELWVVDPLDGTANFVHGFPAVGVSIALVRDGRPVVGVVHAPFLGETYRAVRGGGASVERADGVEPLRVSDRPLGRAIVTTGLPFRRRDALPRFLRTLERVFDAIEDIRRPGAAALDLAWVASGVFEAYFELGLAPWDVAAGGLLVEEAGGRVTDWKGGDGWVTGEILAGNPGAHAGLLPLL
ncbi:MAG: inositol monophosphatase family protein [Actinomycetota bacterium]